MHKLFMIIFTFVFLAACSPAGNRDTFSLWSPVDPEFDKAVRDIEIAYASDDGIDTLRHLTSRLAMMADNDSSCRIKTARAALFMARYYDYVGPYTEGWKSKAQNEIEKALDAYGADSTAHPYDMFRLRYLQNKIRPRSLEEKYYDNIRTLNEATAFNDTLTAAGALNNIGLVHLNLGDSLTAISYFDRSRLMFRQLGMERWEKKLLLSVAQANTNIDPALHDSIMADLHTYAAAKNDTVLLTIVLHNLYASHSDIKYIDEAHDLVKGKPGYENSEAYYKSIISAELINNGLFPDSAARLSRTAIKTMTPAMLPEYSLEIYRNYASILQQENRLDSAVMYLNMSLALQDSISQKNSWNEIIKKLTQHKINENRNAAMKAQLHDRILYASLIVALLFVAMTIIVILLRRHSNLRVAKIESDLQLTRNQLQLASSLLVVKENENAIDTTVKTITQLMDEGRILHADGQRVCSALKAQLNNHDELESFQKVYARIHPNFTQRLLEISSNLSENQIRLAKYIVMGMDNRQISRVMRIEYKSLITARYRLRIKLGLSKEDSLEALLHRLAEI